jgi:hypothetical protein
MRAAWALGDAVKGYQELPQLALAVERLPPPSLECSTCHRLEVARRAEAPPWPGTPPPPAAADDYPTQRNGI